MNKVGKTAMWMAGVGAASFLSYKYLLPKDKKDAINNMMGSMVSNKNTNMNSQN